MAPLQEILTNAIINSETGASEIEATMKKLQKIEYVKAKHVTASGEPRSIKQRSDGRWVGVCPGKYKVYGHTKEELYDNLYNYYRKLEESDRSNACLLDNMLPKAMEFRALTGRTESNSLNRYTSSYKSYINGYINGKSDIRDITKLDLLKLFDSLIKRTPTPLVSEFRNLITALNVLYDYAIEKKYVEFNPLSNINLKAIALDFDQTHTFTDDGLPYEKFFSEEEVAKIREECWKRIHAKKYNVCAYAILIASYTGVRIAEIPPLHWDDIKNDSIHIHRQLLEDRNIKGKDRWYEVAHTKDERKKRHGGRYYELNDNIYTALNLLLAEEKCHGITSEYVFNKANGAPITVQDYKESLLKMCKKLGVSCTNNHAFRKAVNMRLEGEGYNVAERALMLGHSPKVNYEHYTVANSPCTSKDNTQKYDTSWV